MILSKWSAGLNMYNIEIEEAGKSYTAEYVVCEGVIIVYGDTGEISTPLHGFKHEEKAARQLLYSLVKQGKIQPV